MKTFADYISESEVTTEEHNKFVYICSDWELFCTNIAMLNRTKIIKLLNYLLNERHSSKQLLKRAISRFNRLNMLTLEVALSCKKNK